MTVNRKVRNSRRTLAPVLSTQPPLTKAQKNAIKNQALRERAAASAGVPPHTLSITEARRILGLLPGGGARP